MRFLDAMAWIEQSDDVHDRECHSVIWHELSRLRKKLAAAPKYKAVGWAQRYTDGSISHRTFPTKAAAVDAGLLRVNLVKIFAEVPPGAPRAEARCTSCLAVKQKKDTKVVSDGSITYTLCKKCLKKWQGLKSKN